jgi:uncharacterized protein
LILILIFYTFKSSLKSKQYEVQGRRQSGNVEDLRASSGGRSIGFKGGIIGTLAIALVIYLLGGNPLEVLNLMNVGEQQVGTEAPLSAKDI